MNIKLNVLLSLVTGNLLIKDKEWEQLIEAEEFLLRDMEYLDVDESELISSYLTDCFPETTCIKELMELNEDPLITAQFMAKMPRTYKIVPIPIDYEMKEKKSNQKVINISC